LLVRCRETILPGMQPLTQLLDRAAAGDPNAAEQLLPLVYDELRKLAAARLAQEKPGQTLQATALVHEAYLRLVGQSVVGESVNPSPTDQPTHRPPTDRWDSRGHFFAAAAEAMRRILVDQARHKATAKAGGQLQRLELSDVEPVTGGPTLDLLALDEALRKLEQKDPRKAELIKLRFFAGLSSAEAAAVLGVAASTADLDWAYARSWLRLEMSEERPS